MAKIAFGGDGDPDLAVAALEQLGYTVFRLRPEYKERLLDPLDDCLEAIIESRNDDKAIRAIMDEVGSIVDEYDGFCVECGPLRPNHEPFDYLFPDSPMPSARR
jgi:hypothetical protein